MYQIPEDLLFSIMAVEGGLVGQAVGPNVNGTYDLGPMQINSLWVPELAFVWHAPPRLVYNALRDDGCANVFVGAWILKQKISETGDVYSGVAAYHSATVWLGMPYADKVFAAMKKMQKQGAAGD